MTGDIPLASLLLDEHGSGNSPPGNMQPWRSDPAQGHAILFSEQARSFQPTKSAALHGLLLHSASRGMEKEQYSHAVGSEINESKPAETASLEADIGMLTGLSSKLSSVAPLLAYDTFYSAFESGDFIFEFSPRKRRRMDDHDQNDFLLLPRLPPRDSSKTQHRQLIPPLLQGLHEPPPDAGLFPPITATPLGTFDGQENVQVSNVPVPGLAQRVPPVPIHNEEPESFGPSSTIRESGKSETLRKCSKKHKWSEDETNDLLEGVRIYGIGRWKEILNHDGFRLEQRSKVDLKDRSVLPQPWRLARIHHA